jgi:hypothetical protein
MTSDTVGERVTTGAGDRLELPDRALFWRWVWSAVRPVLGWILVAAGALALFLGWYGVSGQALTAKQIPYLVSGGLTGIGLFIVAGVFLATDDVRRQLARVAVLEGKLDQLYALFVEGAAEAEADTDIGLFALPGGSSYHRAGCTLVSGKASAAPVSLAEAARRGLRRCRVCEPPTG